MIASLHPLLLDFYVLGIVALLTALSIWGMKRQDRRWREAMEERYGEISGRRR